MKKNIMDIASRLEDESCKLCEAVCTFYLLLESFEIEGFQAAESEAAALIFAQHFKAYIPTFTLVWELLTEREARIDEIIRDLYKSMKE